MKPGILIRDFDFAGVDADDLGRILRELPVIINLIDELGQYAPFVEQSKQHPGCTESTVIGETLSDLHRWLQYQLEEAFQTLRQTAPADNWAESRALEIVEYAARHTGDLRSIGLDALLLDANPKAILPRKDTGWARRYLKERVTHG